jgi:hypothetical protein
MKWCFFCVIALFSLLQPQAIAWSVPQLLSQKADNSTNVNISAKEVFRKAYENRYTWNPQFPGYTGAVYLKDGKESYRGQIRVNPDMTVEVTGIDKEDARKTVENQLRMLIVHRQRVPFEVAHKNSTFRLGSTDKTGVVEIFEQTDKTESHYKVFEQKLLQVNRLLGKTAVTVDTLDFKTTPEGYLATRYRATFQNPQTNQVLGVEESEDSYIKMDNYYLLKSQVIRDYKQGKLTEQAELQYSNIQLLSGLH